MSAPPPQGEGEAARSGLQLLGLSRTELVLAEALQMEYDALCRLREDHTLRPTTPDPAQTPPPLPARNTPPQGPAHRATPTLDTFVLVPGKDNDPPPAVPPRLHLNQSLCRTTNSNGQSGTPVGRSQTLPPQIPPRASCPVSQRTVSLHSRTNGVGPELFQISQERDEEVAAFCHMLDVLRSAFPHTDRSKNSGFVWSASLGTEQQNQNQNQSDSLKVTIISKTFREPLTFTCDGSSTVDLLIFQTLCYSQDDLDLFNVDDFLLRVCGHHEFLNNSQTLSSLEFVQQCLKFDCDIRLFLTKRSDISNQLCRTKEDDDTPSNMNHNILLQERPIRQTVTREALTLLLDTFHNEAESFLLSEAELVLHVERLVQSVKALCSSLAAVETPELTSALSQLPACPCRLTPRVLKDASVLMVQENREKAVEALTAAILDLMELYCCTFNNNFLPTAHSPVTTAAVHGAGLISSLLSFNVYAAHRIPITWASNYEGFFLSCSVTHGGAELCAPQHTNKQTVSKYLFHLVLWDHRVCFPVQVNQLPRESLLNITLYATPVAPPGGTEEKSKQRRSVETLGWVTMPLFNFRQ